MKRLILKPLLCLITVNFLAPSAHAFQIKPGEFDVQLGGFNSTQGVNQHINIDDLIGNQYTVSNKNKKNGLVGLAFLMKGQPLDHFTPLFGLNTFYLPKTTVNGEIIQEDLFSNFHYQYHVTHCPVYIETKLLVQPPVRPNLNVTIDVGLGPNFMSTTGYTERALNDYSQPDKSFYDHTSVNFSATAGLGMRLSHALGQAPLECGYRFYYLGQGRLTPRVTQILNHLKTGEIYTNAILCSLIV